jgi:hypothetical protein
MRQRLGLQPFGGIPLGLVFDCGNGKIHVSGCETLDRVVFDATKLRKAASVLVIRILSFAPHL